MKKYGLKISWVMNGSSLYTENETNNFYASLRNLSAWGELPLLRHLMSKMFIAY